MRLLSQLRTAFSCCVLIYAACLGAQEGTPRRADTGYPEQAYLSASRYVNAYFGLSFDLPVDTHLHAQADPASRDASTPLLHLTGPAPADAAIVISAIPTAIGKSEDAKLLLRQALDQELYRGVEELHGLTKASFGGREFYYYETRRGIEQHMLLATTSGEYVLRFYVAAHDEKIVKRLEISVEHVVFFAPGALRQYVEADAKPYDGPSISSHWLAILESDPPAKHIDAGNISGDFYENSMLGFSYRIPQGWSIESHGAVQAAVEESRLKDDFGRPRMGRVERRLVDACSRTLFSLWAKRPGPGGRVSYDDFGEVTVSAIALSCFPNMKFPSDEKDREAFKAFLSEYALTHPIVDDMRDGKVFTQDGITFLFLEGTVAFGVADDELSRRLSLGVAITERRGYLLTWFFAAPHEEELRALTNERASFDRGGAVTAANAPQPGGGVAAETGAAGASAPSSSAAQAQSPPAAAGAASAPAAPANQADQSDASTTSEPSTASARPSLLRPGETMESQQGKGPPIKKH